MSKMSYKEYLEEYYHYFDSFSSMIDHKKYDDDEENKENDENEEGEGEPKRNSLTSDGKKAKYNKPRADKKSHDKEKESLNPTAFRKWMELSVAANN